MSGELCFTTESTEYTDCSWVCLVFSSVTSVFSVVSKLLRDSEVAGLKEAN